MTIAIIITAINVILSSVNICVAFRIRNKMRENDEEKDGIRLIFDDCKCIGWYKPNTYEAPSAEVVQ